MKTIDEVIEAFGWTWHPDALGPTASKGLIAEFEDRYSCRLPTPYAYFLWKYGGGWFDPSARGLEDRYVACAMDGDCLLGEVMLFEVYYGFFAPVPDGREPYDIRLTNEVFLGRLPPNLISIGGDASGSHLCLSIEGDDKGAVLLWDHEHSELPRGALDEDIELLSKQGFATQTMDIDAIHYQADLIRVPSRHSKKRGYSNVYSLAPSFDEYFKRLFLWNGG